MPITIQTPAGSSISYACPAVAQIRQTWADDWQAYPALELVEATVATGGQDLDRASFKHRYGTYKHPWESATAVHSSVYLTDWWVRLMLIGQQGWQPAWVGRFAGEGRQIHGGSSTPSGVQTLQAYGPRQMLRKLSLSRSIWWNVEDAEERELAWVPAINRRDRRGQLVGNRSAAEHGGTYLYGGNNDWTHRDYATYLLKRFADDSDDSGPAWTLGGQADVLDDFKEVIPLADRQTVDDVLRQLINPRFGVDWCVNSTDDGFEVFVFTLVAESASFGGVTLPRNPRTMSVAVSQNQQNPSTKVVRTADHRYGKIRVLGERIVVCCSQSFAAETLTTKWAAAVEGAYQDGTGDATHLANQHDAARRHDKYRAVYQDFGAPKDWGLNVALDGAAVCAPTVDNDGQLSDAPGAWQNDVRDTLGWLPLRENWDYSVFPFDDLNPTDHVPAFLPPQAWLYYAEPLEENEETEQIEDWYVYRPAGKCGVGVSPLRNDWGVHLSAHPNHLLARNHWGGNGSATLPLYDYEDLIVTIAFRSDQRLRLEYAIPESTLSDGVLDIQVPDAELWVLAPNTMVGVSAETPFDWSRPMRSPNETKVLRSDAARLGLVMAGAVARYRNERYRAEIVGKGFWPYGALLGTMLRAVTDGADTHAIQGPITSVQWIGGDKPATIIKAGFAR